VYQINIPSQMSREDFLRIFGGVYEHSQWIAEQLYDSGLTSRQDTPEALQMAMATKVELAGKEPQLALLRAHPDLAGKLAVSGNLTEESTSEQASADLGNCTPEEFEAFQSLNDHYKEKFGFPFILAVRGYHRTEILEIFKQRADNDVEAEFNEALTQVHKIALLRLNEIK
jgi:2-oxo-4-hydroxy-4-carboxy-5-ureidoimidazoline decarboxylase